MYNFLSYFITKIQILNTILGPDGSDENSTTCQCPWKLKEFEGPDLLKNRKVSAATVQCIDNRFPGLNISTCAVRCDGTKECLAGEDEKGCQEDKIAFWSSVAAIVMFFVVASILVVHLLAPSIQRNINQGSFKNILIFYNV